MGAGYMRLLFLRSRIIYTLLNERLKIFIIESDAVWLRDPIPGIIYDTDDFDLATANDHPTEVEDLNVFQSPSFEAGFLYLRPTKKVIKLYELLLRALYGDLLSYATMPDYELVDQHRDDQRYLGTLAYQLEINVKYIPRGEVCPGYWYLEHPLTIDPQEATRLKYPSPAIIQNNYIIGIENKINRAKMYRHWYLFDNSNNCDLSNIDKSSGESINSLPPQFSA
eukprot:GHVN01040754.1.p1 GENE.GHVN01040754.1~~GHVN01040754.1.p1  ORF type:complete len:224 (+),score=16.58 GHVN01040754.1:592-1263(+)